MLDLAIVGGRILDGTGNPWFKGDIGIEGGRIVEVVRGGLHGAERTIDARGLVVCPGFIDLHSHSDISIMVNKRARNRLIQGITTDATGNCGMSAHTFTEEYREEMAKRISMRVRREVEVDWTTLREWSEMLQDRGIGINIAPFCGFGTVREAVMGVEGEGGERNEPTSEELHEMRRLVEQAMGEGAFGITTGLEYPPQWNAYTEEIIELCKAAAAHKGVYMSHIRSEDYHLIEAVEEFLRICREAHIPGCISHHKVCAKEHWGEVAESLRLIAEARREGLEIICDVYPWLYPMVRDAGTFLIPPEAKIEDLRDELLERLREPESWAEMKGVLEERRRESHLRSEERMRALAERGAPAPAFWDPLTYWPIVHSPSHPEFIGMTFAEVSESLNLSDPWEALRTIYLKDGGETRVASGRMREEDLTMILRAPFSSVSTDSYAFDECVPLHPRGYGTYPRVLGDYVRERGVLGLEEAVRKMTSLPAQFLGLWDRGLIREGFWADIVVFDPMRVANRATFDEPCAAPEGIEHVIVNGELAVERGICTQALAGRILSRRPL